jgi:hypothetical protein
VTAVVRANTDRHTVEVQVPAAVLEAVLCHIAAEHDDTLEDLLNCLAWADARRNLHADSLAELDLTADIVANDYDAALAAVLAVLPAMVWSMPYADARALCRASWSA